MTSATLRATYREIVWDLLDQMYLESDEPEELMLNLGMNRAINCNRFAVNVLAEAVLSVWTNTPLPASALPIRTSLLVRAIGWGEERPRRARTDHVLVRAPTERRCTLLRYEEHLRAVDYARLTRPTEVSNTGYLTLPEARLLGLRVSEVTSWLATMTRQGQFQSFDARRGRLFENRFLPDQARLAPGTAPNNVILPAWAYCSPEPPRLMAQDEVNLRMAAEDRRRWDREQRMTVRFCPAAGRSEVSSQRDDASPPE